MPPLQPHLEAIAEQVLGKPLKAKRMDQLGAFIAESGWDTSVPTWLDELFRRVLSGEVSQAREYFEEVYSPDSSTMLGGFLTEFSKRFTPLQVEDYGEGLTWKYFPTKVQVFLCRESGRPGFHFLVIRPLDENLNEWLRKK